MMMQATIFQDGKGILFRVGLEVMSVRRVFQMVAAAPGNALTPTADGWVRGMTR